ncbi:MAG: ATP-binding cassette domain-containing protein [Oscillospiraceae bacterium]|nr:ATP-binding cassette domain-containing protein [Oscillospiraceae bacterium]
MLNIRNFSFTYPGREKPALDNINLAVQPGEFIVVCGSSGSGKTTLLRQLKPAMAPHGTAAGEIHYHGQPLSELDAHTAAADIGFVQQCPENQIVTDSVWHELAFGLESLGEPTQVIRLRVAEMAAFFGIEPWFHHRTAELSGGQKQLLNLASIMAMQPQILLLDEPTSQLDPIAAAEFLGTVAKLNRDLGITVILTEHRLEEAFAHASRAIVMDGGRVICDGEPRVVGKILYDMNHPMHLAMPTPMRLFGDCLTVSEARTRLASQCVMRNAQCVIDPPPTQSKAVLNMKNVWFRYEKNSSDVLRGMDFTAHAGEITAILGGNGAGKSTALSVMLGLHRPQRGKITSAPNHKISAVPQNPQSLFIGKTVQEDLREVVAPSVTLRVPAPPQAGEPISINSIAEIAQLCKLESLLQSHPYDLSGGEQQRLALAKALLTRPKILLLDEPTKGLDAQFKQQLAGILHKLVKQGTAIVLVSHDIEFCAQHAHTCALMFDGQIITQAPARAFFAGNSFYTTAANRIARWAVTCEDLCSFFEKKEPKKL